MKIAITGIAGRFGRVLAGLLHRHHTVVGTTADPVKLSPKMWKYIV